MPDFTDLVDLAQERLGGSVLYANDDFFASKDNLLKPSKPIFIEGKYTDRGKWMDGWESRRRRTAGHDFCLVRLGAPGIVRGVVVDTAFFRGNFPERFSLEACALPGHPDPEQLMSAATRWTEILPATLLRGDALNAFPVDAPYRFTHLRFNIFPDGGVARLRVHGDVLPDPRWLGPPGGGGVEVDLASVENGGAVIACNDMFFGSRHNLIVPGRSVNMGDGWETKRSRRAGPDWVIVQLAATGTVSRVEVDTHHFKGNFPESCGIEVCHAPDATTAQLTRESVAWTEILPRTKLQGHTRHFYEAEISPHPPATHARFSIWPDGGVSRLRLWGSVAREGRERFGMRWVDALTPDELNTAMRACCGAKKWAEAMVAKRPFGTLAGLTAAASEAFAAMSEDDWSEAFKAHPRIGERKAAAEQGGGTARGWAAQEQSRVAQADAGTKEALAQGNREYEARFGHIFLICATGKTADEMLASLRTRLGHDAATELRVAAEEQKKITQLRLEKLVTR